MPQVVEKAIGVERVTFELKQAHRERLRILRRDATQAPGGGISEVAFGGRRFEERGKNGNRGALVTSELPQTLEDDTEVPGRSDSGCVSRR